MVRKVAFLLLAALVAGAPARAEAQGAGKPSTAASSEGTGEAELHALTERIALEPKRAELRMLLGRALVDRNRQVEAIAAFEAYAELGGKDPAVLKLAGQLCAWNERPREALVWFDRYLEVRPDDTDVLKLAAQFRVWNDRQIEALPYIDRFLSRRSGDVELIELAGKVNLWNGRPDAAIPYFERLLELKPGDTKTVKLLGQTHLWGGRPGKAIPLFARLNELAPGDTDAVNLLGQAYLADRRPREALPWFRRRVERDPGDTVAVRLLGEALLAGERPSEARRQFLSLRDRCPGDTLPVRLIAESYVAEDRGLEAIPWYKRLLGMEPGNRDALRMIGSLYAWNGRPAEALPWLRRYNRAFVEPGPRVLEAQCLSGLGRKEEARAKFARLLDTFRRPDEEGARTIAGALLYEDPVLADAALARYAKGASPGLRLFLAATRLRLYTNLGYASFRDAAARETLAAFAAAGGGHKRYAEDCARAAEALSAAGRTTAAVALAAAALRKAGGKDPLLRFALARARHVETGDPLALAACRDLALLADPPRDAGLYYAERETDEIRLAAFADRYDGPDKGRDGYLDRLLRLRHAQGDTAAARSLLAEMPEGILKERGRALLDPADPAPREALAKLDPYDAGALAAARRLLAGDAARSASLEVEVERLRKEREAENIARLRRLHDHFTAIPEPACDLAKALFWSGGRTEAVELVDAKLRALPGDETLLAWRYRFTAGERRQLTAEEVSLARRLAAKGLLEPLELADALEKGGLRAEALELVDGLPVDRRSARKAIDLRMRGRDHRGALARLRDFVAKFGRDDSITLAEAELQMRRRNAPAARRALRLLEGPPDAASAGYVDYLRRTSDRESSPTVRYRNDYAVDSERLARRSRTLEAIVPWSNWRFEFGYDNPLVDRSLGLAKALDLTRAGVGYVDERQEARGFLSFMGGGGGDIVKPTFEWRRGDLVELHLRHRPRLDTPEAIAGGFYDREFGGSGTLKFHPRVEVDWNYDRIRVDDGNKGFERGVTLAVEPWRGSPFRLTATQSASGFDRTGLDIYYSPERRQRRSYGVNLNLRRLPLFAAVRHYLESNGNEGSSYYGVLPVKWRGLRMNLDTSYSEAKSGRFEARRYNSRYVGLSLEQVF